MDNSANGFSKANALIHFYFNVSLTELNNLSLDEWCEKYNQMVYAIEFDARRSSGDNKKPAKLPF